ncbi:MAG: pyruvate kinase alpha/beta domain-containing protein [Candidatus Thorarchaeota archaeon]
MKVETFHFKEASQSVTNEVIALVRKFLDKNPEFDKIIVATTEGATGVAVARAFKDYNVIVVSHQTGFAKPNENELKEEYRAEIIKEGAHLLTTTHAFAGVPRGIRRELGTWQATEIIAVALRTFGQGTKVCAEIAMMAADAGLVQVDNDVICIGGTGRGADTAWVVQPANTQAFSKLRMRACICRPIEF